MSELRGIARLTFHEGKVEEFKRLLAEVLEVVRTQDTGTLEYEIYLDESESECIFVERFRDADALIEHNANLGDLLGQMLSTGSVSAELCGELDDERKAQWADGSVRFFAPFRAL